MQVITIPRTADSLPTTKNCVVDFAHGSWAPAKSNSSIRVKTCVVGTFPGDGGLHAVISFHPPSHYAVHRNGSECCDLHLAGRTLVVDISKVEDTSMYIVHGLLALAKAEIVDW